MIYYRNSGSIIPEPSRSKGRIVASVNYPLIVLNSFKNIYGVDMDSAKSRRDIDANFKLEVNYAYLDLTKSHVNEFFLIDILSYETIDAFLGELEKDVEVIGFLAKET